MNQNKAKIVDNLIKVRDLIGNGDRWCKMNLALDGPIFRGAAVDPLDPEARCWCLVGAIIRIVEKIDYPDVAESLTMEIRRRNPLFQSIWSFNDHPDTRHSDVLSVIDGAIEKLKSGPAEG